MKKAHPLIHHIIYALLLTACASAGQPDMESGGEISLPFTENFDDEETCFNREVEPYGVLDIENGEFIIGVKAENQLVWATCENLLLDDFTFEMDFYDETNGDGFRFFGLQFRKGPVDGGSNQYYLVRFGLGGGDPPASCAGMARDHL